MKLIDAFRHAAKQQGMPRTIGNVLLSPIRALGACFVWIGERLLEVGF